jgi:hypothetical protein
MMSLLHAKFESRPAKPAPTSSNEIGSWEGLADRNGQERLLRGGGDSYRSSGAAGARVPGPAPAAGEAHAAQRLLTRGRTCAAGAAQPDAGERHPGAGGRRTGGRSAAISALRSVVRSAGRDGAAPGVAAWKPCAIT